MPSNQTNQPKPEMNVIEFANQLFCILILVGSLRILAIQIAHDKIQMVKQENVRQKWRDMAKQVILKNQTDCMEEEEEEDKCRYENLIHSGRHSTWNTVFDQAVFISAIHNPMNIALIPLRIVFPSQYNGKEDGYSM